LRKGSVGRECTYLRVLQDLYTSILQLFSAVGTNQGIKISKNLHLNRQQRDGWWEGN
jgi:hypothetical protein